MVGMTRGHDVKKLLAVALGLGVVASTTAAAVAGPPAPVPDYMGGGTVTVDVLDFTYPKDSGCYLNYGTVTIAGNDASYYREVDVSLQMFAADGEIVDMVLETYRGTGSLRFDQQLCRSFDAPGSFTVRGEVSFVDWDYDSYEVPVTDTYVIKRPAPKRYGSCKKLWKHFPAGAAKSKKAATKLAKRGYQRASSSARAKGVYRVNKRLDPNRNGVACERRR
jgi:hypothetical protein